MSPKAWSGAGRPAGGRWGRTGSLGIVLLGLALVGCPGDHGASRSPGDSLSTRQRDSVIGASGLPGARGVRKALEVSDSARARSRRIDSIGGP